MNGTLDETWLELARGHCAWCGCALKGRRPARGRPLVYCTPAHRAKAHYWGDKGRRMLRQERLEREARERALGLPGVS